jgi:hypothetical protein
MTINVPFLLSRSGHDALVRNAVKEYIYVCVIIANRLFMQLNSSGRVKS